VPSEGKRASRDSVSQTPTLRFDLPNWQPWVFAGELAVDGGIVGVLSSEQGGVPVTFRRAAALPDVP
jgi:hypothetical protein